MAEIWQHSRIYACLRPFVDFCALRSYRRIEVEGPIPPSEGAVIVAPNHTNCLMDPLLVLPFYRKGISFGARADIFRKPKIARILRELKMVPMARQSRDLPEEVARNLRVFDEIDRNLEHGMPFCLFCEGRHRPMHSLLPARRGVAVLAYRSAEKRPTVIVPVGIDYSDWFHYRGIVRIKFGEPIDVNALLPSVEGMEEKDRDLILQKIVHDRLSELIVYLPDDDKYEERLAEIEASKPEKYRFRRVLQAVLGLPLFLVCALLSLPMWVTAECICRWAVKDPAFQNTARFAVKLVGTPLIFIIWAVLFFLLLPWWAAAGLLLLFLPSYSIFYDWLNVVFWPQRPLWK